MEKIGRGRPVSITQERIADAGIALGLPNITMVAMATELGVSQTALYKHVKGVESLKALVAEAMFLRWALPLPPNGSCRSDLEAYLEPFSDSLWNLVDVHPGIAPYMLQEDMITEAMMAKIGAHQQLVADAFGLSLPQSVWLLFTIAYHCVAIADTVLPKSPTSTAEVPRTSFVSNPVKAYYSRGIRALIIGTLALLDEV